jgi:hypothetical protein
MMVHSTRIATALLAGCLAPMALGDCSQLGGAGSHEKIDPNDFPTSYRTELVTDLTTNSQLSDVTNAREAYVSAPVLRQLETQSRYVVCLRTVSPDERRDRMVVFFAGRINQMRDATPEQCGAAAYQPFPELLSGLANLRGKNSKRR